MKTIALAVALIGAALPASAAPSCTAVGGVCLTPRQAAIVRENFTTIRSCPLARDFIDPAEAGGDCTGGQSGTPFGGG